MLCDTSRIMDGKAIRQFRLRMGWTQAQLAQEVGVTRNTIARWERNEMGISGTAAKLLALLIAKPPTPARRR
jgi:transcriptional regulator with XRE-family HTH domain